MTKIQISAKNLVGGRFCLTVKARINRSKVIMELSEGYDRCVWKEVSNQKLCGTSKNKII